MNFGDARITVLGDRISDEWIHGRIERLSPEGPWPVFLYERTVTQAGGACNVQANLMALGCPATLITPLRTSVKQRYVVGRHQVFRVDVEKTSRFSLQEEDDLLAKVKASRPQVLVLSDYGKGCFAGDLAQRCIKWCAENSVHTVVDPKGDWLRYSGATIITPNSDEIPKADPRVLLRMFGLRHILLTQGAHGMTLFPAGEPSVHVDAIGPNVVDVVGAGDSVVAAVALALATQMPLDGMVRMANAVAGVVVGKSGTATCSREELQKVYPTRGKLVGLANGCFDTLHIGHVQLLKQAKARCDHLIVALNSDESVRRLKGHGRPVNDFATRAQMLSAIEYVDSVYSFDTENELWDMIPRHNVKLIFKGTDYAGRQITGADLAEVVLIDTPTKSSTDDQLWKRKAAE